MADVTEPRPASRRFKRVEYERLVEAGVFGPDDKIELIGGLLVVREPQYSPRATGITLALHALQEVFGAGWLVRPNLPTGWAVESDPEPDLVVVGGTCADYTEAHPTSWASIFEVANH